MAIIYGKHKFADRIPKIDFTAALAVASLDIGGKKSNSREILAGLKETAAEINRAIGLRP